MFSSAFPAFLAVLLVAAPGLASAQPALSTNPAYADELIAKTRDLKLSQERQWLRLGHYQTTATGSYLSQADGAAFFLSPTGKTDPQAELEATVRGLFVPSPTDPTKLGAHPQCQFPARMAWLYGKLTFDLKQVPLQECAKFNAFARRVAPQSVTLVFSSYFLNNPASAFGHTFLRLNKAPREQRGQQDELRDYGIDYAATVDTNNPILYLLNGLTGRFPGNWNHYPYFYKVREYSDSESRDLWEYDLNLTPGQMAMLVAHLWELGSTYFDYFYLDENCSYHVLGALEAAAPELELLKHTRFFVLPSDTVRAVNLNPGLVKSVHYRPSIRTQFMARAKDLTSDQADRVEKLAANPAETLPANLPPSEAVTLMDAAVDFIDLRDGKEIIYGQNAEAAARRQNLLERRSELRTPSPPLQIDVPEKKQPHLGHPTSRIGVGVGTQRNRSPYLTYEGRLVFHDLVDRSDGYPELAMIEFLPFRFRHEIPFERFMLEEFNFVKVMSLTPLNRYDLKPSWRLRAGVITVRDGGCAPPGCLAGALDIGGGFAASIGGDILTVFALGDLSINASGALDGPWGAPVRPTIGPSVGARLKVTDRFTTLLQGSYLFHGERTLRTSYSAQWVGRFHLTDQFAANLEIKALPNILEGSIGALLYF